MKSLKSIIRIALLAVATQSLTVADEKLPEQNSRLSAAVLAVSEVSPARLKELKASAVNCVVLQLKTSNDVAKQAIRAAANSIEATGVSVGYWIEVARSTELADKHPEWMASLQTHDEWRRFFPNTPEPTADEVAKTYPWVPILSRKPYEAQRRRVVALLRDLPKPQLIFLNDLQGAPSACGCGNSLCRWTSDYGDRRTTVPLRDDAAALFIAAIRKASPESEVIPVWTTECEEYDGHPDGLCAGVGCFQGICWKAYTRQLMPVAATSNRIAVLATYKQFLRDSTHYGPDEAGWVGFAIKSFETMPPRHNGRAIAASRMIAVVQGWDVTAEEVAAQRKAAEKAGAGGCVVAYEKIEQGWSPKVIPWK